MADRSEYLLPGRIDDALSSQPRLADQLASGMGRRMRLLRWCMAAPALTTLVLACAHAPGKPLTDPSSGIDLAAMAKRFSFPTCEVSVPLSQDDVIRMARWGGDPHPELRPEWEAMRGMTRAGDQVRMVSCTPRRGRGGVVFFGLFRDRSMIAELHTAILD